MCINAGETNVWNIKKTQKTIPLTYSVFKKELDSDYKHAKKKHLLVQNVTFTPVTTIESGQTTLFFRKTNCEETKYRKQS